MHIQTFRAVEIGSGAGVIVDNGGSLAMKLYDSAISIATSKGEDPLGFMSSRAP